VLLQVDSVFLVTGLGAVSRDSGHAMYTPGDHVKVCVDIDTVKKMQEDHGGWTLAMEQVVWLINTSSVIANEVLVDTGLFCTQQTAASSSVHQLSDLGRNA